MTTVRCGPCFGRGYRGGGKLPTCRRCRGTGSVTFETERRAQRHVAHWDRVWLARSRQRKA